MSQCYSTGAVCGNWCVGGLVGDNVGQGGPGVALGSASGTVTQCYSTGAVSGSGSVGGLVGQNTGNWGLAGIVDGCFWDMQTSGQATSEGGTGLPTPQMQTAQTFLDAGWDFVGETVNGPNDVWKIIAGQTYPLLSWQKYSGGTGEPNDPHQIATAADLIALGETPADYDKHFLLIADIDLDPNLPGGKVFGRAVIAADTNDIEDGFGGTSFTGVFDGNGHTISRLTIRGDGYLGLFGQLGYCDSGPYGHIKNLGLVDVSITASDSYVGGLVAVNAESDVTECYSTGTICGRSFVGGLVGEGEVCGVTRCYSRACVRGSGQDVGGLVGMITDWSSVTQCYSTGAVNGNRYVGGLVGINCRWGRVTQCYSTGAVSGADCVGGLVGFDEWGGGTACFWDTQTSGQASSAGGTGKTSAEMQTAKTFLDAGEMQTAKTFLDAGWDFAGETANGTEDIWKIAEGLDYPRLWWEPYDGRVTVVLGQIFTVTLESNPSTGYRWEWVDNQDSIVEQIGEAQFKPRETGDPPLVGAGGWESFDFKAVHQGQMTLKLVYRRPWEEGVEPLKTFSLQVAVP